MTTVSPDYLRFVLPVAAQRLEQGPIRDPPSRGLHLRLFFHLLLYALRYWVLLAWPGWRFIRSLRSVPPGPRNLYLAVSLSQRRTLQPVYGIDPDATVVARNGTGQGIHLSRGVAISYALQSLADVITLFMDGNVRTQHLLAENLRPALAGIGYLRAWRRVFAAVRVRSLVIASDTVVSGLAAAYAAREAGVPSLYIPHGCATAASPALITDYALLDGEYSRELRIAGGECRAGISLIGITRFGGVRHPDPGVRRRRIAVCGGHLTSRFVLAQTLDLIRKRFAGDTVILRLHPNQYRRWNIRRHFRGARLSDPVAEHPAEFLQTADVVIAGSSSILMEGALLHVLPIYYRLLDDRPAGGPANETAFDPMRTDRSDYYGFIANGLCLTADTPEDLLRAILQRDTNRARFHRAAKPYCDTAGTEFEFRSHELALRCIRRAGQRQALPLHWGAL